MFIICIYKKVLFWINPFTDYSKVIRYIFTKFATGTLAFLKAAQK